MSLLDLNPQTWAVKAGAALAATAVVASLVGAIYLNGRHSGVAAERPKTAAAQDQAAASKLEVQGAQEAAQRVDAYQHLDVQVHEATARAVAQAQAAPDATVLLDPARAARLRAHDDELCAIRPVLCPGALPSCGNAGAGQTGVCPGALGPDAIPL